VLRLIGPAVASCALCLMAVLALRPLAIAVDLIDRPGGRKTHHGDVPIVGGLAMYLGVVLGISLLSPVDPTVGPFLAACTVLVTVGLIDDRFDLSPWTRLPAQICAAIVLVVGAGALITTIGDPFGFGEVTLSGGSSVIFTILTIIAAINAFNMLDGMDGLAGATALISLIALAVMAWPGDASTIGLCFVIGGSICAFLVFNLPTHTNRSVRCFMGDAGSTLLGFCVACVCIRVSQGVTSGKPVAPVATLWAVAMPLYELFWTTLRRILRGTSPFRADTSHFHHLLLKAGFGVRGAFAVFVVLASLLAACGVITSSLDVPAVYSFLMLVGAGVGVVMLMYRADLLWRVVPESMRRIAPLDGGVTRADK
jgi:UDP-GlcNAc:undecaprenyl-phosphate/decaprenyl-phosphate GlcNAc-1-phosphate transferase